MKKIVSLAMIAALVITSCNKIGSDDPKDDGTLKATIENLATKADYTTKDGLNWAEGDVISVYTSGSRFAEYTIQEGAGTKTAKFAGLLKEGESRSTVAVAPASLKPEVSGSSLTITVPATIEGGAAEAISLPVLVSAISKYSDLTFKYVTGYAHIGLNLPAGADKITLTTSKKIAGTFTTTVEDAEIKAAEGSDNTIAVTFPAAAAGAKKAILLPLPTGEYPAGDVVFTLYSGTKSIATVTNPKKINATRANVIDLGTYAIDAVGTVEPVDVPSAKTVNTLIGLEKAQVIVTLPDEDVAKCLIEWKGGAQTFDVPNPVPEDRKATFTINEIAAGTHPFVVYMQDVAGNTSRPAGCAGKVLDQAALDAIIAAIPDSKFAPEGLDLVDPVMTNAMDWSDAPWIQWGTKLDSTSVTKGTLNFRCQDYTGAWQTFTLDSGYVNAGWLCLDENKIGTKLLLKAADRTTDSIIRHDTEDRIGFYWWMEYDVDNATATVDMGNEYMDDIRYQTRTINHVKLEEHINDW